jgi:hypothetical protein
VNPLLACDFAIKHKVVADRIASEADEFELALELLRLFDHTAHALHTELGCLAITSTLQEIASANNEHWNDRHAAELILAYQMMADLPSVPSELRDIGAHALDQRWNVINVTSDVVEAVRAIAAVWFRLLPELDVPLLEHVATELYEGLA